MDGPHEMTLVGHHGFLQPSKQVIHQEKEELAPKGWWSPTWVLK
jgi:hypothetical protein